MSTIEKEEQREAIEEDLERDKGDEMKIGEKVVKSEVSECVDAIMQENTYGSTAKWRNSTYQN